MQVIRNVFGRELVKTTLKPLLRWQPLDAPAPGYSIMVGVPWDLRHLLSVNLLFIMRGNLENLHTLHVIFDRCARPEMAEIEDEMRREFPELPLVFHHYRGVAGRIIEKVNVSTFYNSMNCQTALAACETRWMILHDFDLYPLATRYFEEIWERTASRELKFSGIERTHFNGLTEADDIFGTWALAMDAQWLRNECAPLDVFHRVARVGDRTIGLDPFAWLQLNQERAAVETLDRNSFCHVNNLCSTYLRLVTGRWVSIAWRLHYLWYLEYLAGDDEVLQRAIDAMQAALERSSTRLNIASREIDFQGIDASVGNVLRDELTNMELALHDEVRQPVAQFISCSRDFFTYAESRSSPATAVGRD